MQTTSAENYYDLLAIDREASFNEIKKAYFSKVREFPNETHPVQFQNLTKAYKVLINADTRTKYDQELKDDGSYNKLLDHIYETMGKGEYTSALNKLESMLVLYPGDLSVQQNMAMCFINLDQFDEAKQLLMQLKTTDPDNELTLNLLGRTYENLKVYHQAKECYEKLVTLDPKESNYYIRLAGIYLSLKNHDQSLEIIEKKLSQGKETVYDFPLLEELFFITMIADKKTYHNEVIQRIKNLYSTSEEKDQLLNMLISSCEGIDNDNNGFKEMVYLVKDINNDESEEVSEWLRKAESYIRSDLIYYGDPVPFQAQDNLSNTATTNGPGTTNYVEEDDRGSIFFSIILGVIASFFLSPIGGIIVGIIWYFNAEALKKIIGFLGCLAVVIILGFLILSGM